MSSNGFSLETIDIISPDHYMRNGYPHPEWTWLRRNRPVFWYDRPNVQPFWAITKYADVVAISRQPRLFLNGPRLLVVTKEYGVPAPGEQNAPPFRHLLDMDPPEHGTYRSLINQRFTPRAVRQLAPQIDRIAREIAAEIADRGACDFVIDFSSKIPLAVIAEQLGVPREDWEMLFRWTNETIGGADPEFQDGTSTTETLDRARLGLFSYFNDLVQKRQKEPRDDLTTVIANARVDGNPLPPLELLSYFFLLVVAGNETTRNATTGGLLALVENPDQWRRLKADPSLLTSAVEEIVRWTTPVIQFARTAKEDTEVRGQKIRAGESLCLFYPSANRDEEVFEEPSRFDIGRNPNPHIAFGIGEHFCLGANLARLELEIIFRNLIELFDSLELAGPVERLRSSFVGGIKHMPISYTTRSASARL
jgi:cholest-4-en-3-one 26-monooxygenase